jgi:PEGA domain
LPYDDVGKVARLKTNPHAGPPGRGRSEPAAPSGDAKQQIIQVATRCATLDEFVEKFATFAWEGSLVLPAATALPVGTQGRFVVLLKDQTVAMRGRCRVTEAKPTPVSSRNPAVKRVMMRVALLEMDEPSRIVHRRLVALRSAPVPLPVPPEASETTQIEPARGGTAPGAAAAPAPPVAAVAPAPPVAAAPPVSPAPPGAAALAPPIPPVKAPPPAPPINLNRTMIGVGIAPITQPKAPAPVARPVAAVPSPAPAASSAPVVAPAPVVARRPTPARVETRVPGAPDQLPANPLAQFDANDVESFIDCTLIETDADVPIDVAGASPEESVAVATNVYVRPVKAAPGWVQSLAKKLPPRFQVPAVRAAPYAPYAAIAVISIVVGVIIGHSGKRTPPAPPTPVPVIVQAPTPVPAAVPEPEMQAAAPKPAAVVAAPPAPKPAAAARAPVAIAEKPAAAAEKPAVVAEKPAVVAEKPAARAALPPAETAPPTGDCTARVVTEPKDAKVLWAGTVIGRSPIDGARVPCGPATVTIERERWQPVTVDVNAQAGVAAKVHERLRRPRTALAVSSTPPGAQISVNHVAAGAAPKRIDVQRFEQVQVRATLKGYQPWNKTLYLKEADAKLDIQLVARK